MPKNLAWSQQQVESLLGDKKPGDVETEPGGPGCLLRS
jgi:hypothetical protein